VAIDYKGGYDANTDTPALDGSSGPISTGIKQGDSYTVTADGTFFTELVEIGDYIIAEVDDPSSLSDWTRLNKNIEIAVGGSGTSGRIAKFTGANSVGDTALTEPSVGSMAGTPSTLPVAVDNSLINECIPMGTSVDGELVDSGLRADVGFLRINGNGNFTSSISIQDFYELQGGANSSILQRFFSSEWRVQHNDGIHIRLFNNNFQIGDDGNTANTDITHQSATAGIKATIRTDNLTGSRTQDWSNVSGDIAVYSDTFASNTILMTGLIESGELVNAPLSVSGNKLGIDSNGFIDYDTLPTAERIVQIPDRAGVIPAHKVDTITSTTFTTDEQDEHILADDDTAAAVITVTLQAASSRSTPLHIKKIGSTANIVINADGSDTIDGAASKTLTSQYEAITLVSNGTNWHIF